MDRRLHNAIEDCLESPRASPRLGKELVGGLSGMRSVRIEEFLCRVVYRIDDDACAIHVDAMRHRSAVYEDLARRLQGC